MATRREEAAEQGPRRRRLGLALVICSVLTICIDLVGAWNPWRLVWVERLMHHPFVFGVPVAIAGSIGLALLTRSRSLNAPVWLAGFGVACAWAGFGWLSSGLSAAPVSHLIPAPDGDGPSYELVVRDSSDGFIDPAWLLSVRTTGTIWAREWQLGCMSGDDDGNAYDSAHWLDRTTLILRSHSGRTTKVEVDPTTGRPSQDLNEHWTC